LRLKFRVFVFKSVSLIKIKMMILKLALLHCCGTYRMYVYIYFYFYNDIRWNVKEQQNSKENEVHEDVSHGMRMPW